jgi:ribosome biogenesis protein UTP30
MAEQHLDAKQVSKAVKALLAHRKGKGGKGLDLDAAAFTLQVGLKKAPVDPSPKPRLIALPHRLKNDAGDRRGCLIVKDADKPWLKALLLDGERPGPKSSLTKKNGTRAARMDRRAEPAREAGTNGDDLQIEGIHKVLALSKLRTSYKQFKDKRELRDRFDDFYCDDRVTPMLGKLLGKTFFDRKRQPISVRVTRGPEALKEQMRKADCSARFVLKEGTCCALVCATTDLEEKEVVENIVAACAGLVNLVPKKWRNVQSVVLKLPDSASLPIFAGALDAAPKKRKVEEVPKQAKKARKEAPVAATKPKGRSLNAKLKALPE